MPIRAQERMLPAHNTKVNLNAGGESLRSYLQRNTAAVRCIRLSYWLVSCGFSSRAAPIHLSHGCSPA